MIGIEILINKLKQLPTGPGIYYMINKDQKIIYIGKAKNIKNRIQSYISQNRCKKTKLLISQIHDLDYITTNSEVEALLLEAQQIKKLQPKFNILLKDDKMFPYIKLSTDHDFPQLTKYRSKNPNNKTLFGPYMSSTQVDFILKELQKIFKLRSCSDSYFKSRKQPCLQYQINRCYAPCVNKITQAKYKDLVTQTLSFLQGNTKLLQDKLINQMNNFSQELKFEEACEIRDRVNLIKQIQSNTKLLNMNVTDCDIISIAEKESFYCITISSYRSNIKCGIRSFFFSYFSKNKQDIIESFIGLYYQNTNFPKEILLNITIKNQNVIEEALYQLYQSTIKIKTPKSGLKLKLVDEVYKQAYESLEQRIQNNDQTQQFINELSYVLNINNDINRIEVYDNSHISGKCAIAAMIVWTPSGFDKKEYRYFNIEEKENNTKDDYLMMKKILTHRIKKIKQKNQKKPDLIIIDGGKGHLSTALEVMKKLDLIIPCLCISKGKKRNSGQEFFYTADKEYFTFQKNSLIMKRLQILRDEAHNFAIKRHRNKRTRLLTFSYLDTIQSVGKIKKHLLIKHFGSYQSIKSASLEDLCKVKNIGKKTAEKIYFAINNKKYF